MSGEDYQRQPSFFSRLSKTAAAEGTKFLAKQTAKKGILYLGRLAAAAGSAGTTLLAEGALRLGKKIPGILKGIRFNLALSSSARSQEEEKTIKWMILAATVGLPLLLVILVILPFMVVGSASYVASGRGGVIPEDVLRESARLKDTDINPQLIKDRLDLNIFKASRLCQIKKFNQEEWNSGVSISLPGGGSQGFSSKGECFRWALLSLYPNQQALVDGVVGEISRSISTYQNLQCVGYLKALHPIFRRTSGNAVDYYYKKILPKEYKREDYKKGMKVNIGDILVWPGEEGNCEENIRACGHIAVVVGIKEGEIEGGERYIITTQAEGLTGEIIRLTTPESILEKTKARIIKRK